MAERDMVVDGRDINYSGLMNLREMLLKMDDWLMDNGWDKDIMKTFEENYDDGKQVTIEYIPFKKVSYYVKYRIEMRMYFTKLKEVEVEKAGVKTKLMKGNAHISFDTFVEYDFDNFWERKQMFIFLRFILNKYVYNKQIDEFKKAAIRETIALENYLKEFLNLHRYI